MSLLKYNRIIISIISGVIAGLCCFLIRWFFYKGAGDFEWALRASRDVVKGYNPYAYQYKGIDVPYPLTAVFTGLPFVNLSDELAAALFLGFSPFFLAHGLLREGLLWKLLIFLSPSYFYALAFVQWSPLLVAMSFFPLFLFLLVIKPHVAIPLAFSGLVRWKWYAIVVTVAMVLLSLVIMPIWPFWIVLTIYIPSFILLMKNEIVDAFFKIKMRTSSLLGRP